VRTCVIASWLAVVVVGVGVAQAAVAATRTTAPSPYVSIHVTLTNSKVVMSPTAEPRGAIARFIVYNAGTKPVRFNVGAEKADRTKGFGFTEVIRPGQRHVRLLYLALRGPLPYYVGSSYSGAKAAQKGALHIGDTCDGCAVSTVMPPP